MLPDDEGLAIKSTNTLPPNITPNAIHKPIRPFIKAVASGLNTYIIPAAANAIIAILIATGPERELLIFDNPLSKGNAPPA